MAASPSNRNISPAMFPLAPPTGTALKASVAILPGMTIFPVTTPSILPPHDSPCLEYQMYLFSAGHIEVESYLSPTLNFVAGRGLRFRAVLRQSPAPDRHCRPRGLLRRRGRWQSRLGANRQRQRPEGQILLHARRPRSAHPQVLDGGPGRRPAKIGRGHRRRETFLSGAAGEFSPALKLGLRPAWRNFHANHSFVHCRHKSQLKYCPAVIWNPTQIDLTTLA